MKLRLQYNSPVILSFVLAAIAVFVADGLMQGLLMPLFTLTPDFSWSNPISYLRLFSYTLGHASLQHLWGNLTFILLVGPVIEEKYGSRNTLVFIGLTALVTAIVHLFLFPHGLLGASGVVFMLIVLVSFTNARAGSIPLTFVIIAVLFVGKEIIESLRPDNVSQFAHIFGGILGAWFGFSLASKPDKTR